MPDAAVAWQSSPVRRAPHVKMLPLLRKAVATAPARDDLKIQLAVTLRKADRMTELVDWLSPVAADADTAPDLLMCLADAALAVGDNRLAFTALRTAADQGVDYAYGRMAESLIKLGRFDEALDAGLAALERMPTDHKALPVVARVLLDRNEKKRLWELCAGLRARGVYGGHIPSAMALAAETAAQDDEVANLIEPTRWFSATPLGVPDDFNDRLAAELLGHPFLYPIPRNRATRGDTKWVLQLELAGGPATQDLHARLRAAVSLYVAERQGFADHPILAQHPASVEISSWSLAARDDGCQTWHLHAGWLSGIYYVEMPAVRPRRDSYPGAIEFGLYPFDRDEETLRSPRWQIVPEPGLLLLFPSYLAHRTWPTQIGDSRICVAFDVRASEPIAGAALPGNDPHDSHHRWDYE